MPAQHNRLPSQSPFHSKLHQFSISGQSNALLPLTLAHTILTRAYNHFVARTLNRLVKGRDKPDPKSCSFSGANTPPPWSIVSIYAHQSARQARTREIHEPETCTRGAMAGSRSHKRLNWGIRKTKNLDEPQKIFFFERSTNFTSDFPSTSTHLASLAPPSRCGHDVPHLPPHSHLASHAITAAHEPSF